MMSRRYWTTGSSLSCCSAAATGATARPTNTNTCTPIRQHFIDTLRRNAMFPVRRPQTTAAVPYARLYNDGVIPPSQGDCAGARGNGRPMGFTKNETRLRALCVFCGSQAGTDPAFRTAAATLGAALAAHGTTLVYGGGRTGLMGAIADATLAAQGSVVGVIPEFLREKELAHTGATELIIVPDMHTRKRIMSERADAFCILPGGVGTLEEFFEILTWRQLHRHNKPIVILNTAEYWTHLIGLFERIIAGGFAHRGHENLLTVVKDPGAVIGAIEQELAAPKPPPVLEIEGITAFGGPQR
jgi:uncharacterized protein (TIGR00730 family)